MFSKVLKKIFRYFGQAQGDDMNSPVMEMQIIETTNGRNSDRNSWQPAVGVRA